MTRMTRLIINAGLAAIACVASTGLASACGCLTSRSFTMSNDDTNVYATATFSFSYLCTGDVTATVSAPDTTTAFNDSGITDPPTAQTTAAYTYGLQDGTYNGVGTYYYDGQDAGLGQGYFPPMQAQQQVQPFLRLVSASWSGPIGAVAGSADFMPTVLTSLGCSGNVRVEADMTPPANAAVFWDSAQGTNTSTDKTLYLPQGMNTTYTFTAKTAAGNSVTGPVIGTATITSKPAACQIVPMSAMQMQNNTMIQ